jgi:hypothetical protein
VIFNGKSIYGPACRWSDTPNPVKIDFFSETYAMILPISRVAPISGSLAGLTSGKKVRDDLEQTHIGSA